MDAIIIISKTELKNLQKSLLNDSTSGIVWSNKPNSQKDGGISLWMRDIIII